MKNKIRVGLYGSNGHQIHSKLHSHSKAELAAMCGVSEAFSEYIKENFPQPITVYGSLEEMLRDKSLTVISICSPRRIDQEEDIIACLRAGKHVYAEKPAVLSERALERVLAVSKESGCEFHEMADTVFDEPYWTMRRLVQSGKIGEVVQVYIQKSYPMHPDTRPQDETTDGGLIRWAGIHGIRFLEHITGLRVRAVSAYQTRLGAPRPDGMFTAASLSMTLENGGVASACFNYLNPDGFGRWGNESVRIFGDRGMIEVTDGKRRSHLYTQEQDEGELDITGSDCRDYFDWLIDHLHSGSPMPMSQEEELHPLRTVLRAWENAVEIQI